MFMGLKKSGRSKHMHMHHDMVHEVVNQAWSDPMVRDLPLTACGVGGVTASLNKASHSFVYIQK
jgi:hypothetical protein